MGRVAAKDAVCLLVENRLGEGLAAAEVEIVPDSYGRPRTAGAWTERLGIRPAVSITHSHGTAVALAALGSSYIVGIDLEHLPRRREDFESIAFSAEERGMLDAMPADLRQEWALRMWCAKESLAKALGRGFSAGIQAFHIAAASLDSGEMQLELRDGALRQFPHLRGESMIAYTAREMDFVFSTMVCQQGAVE
jgi:phosphopantetheinyl transferase